MPWWEFVVRGVVLYLFLLLWLRLTGRRQIGQYDPFDLILLLMLSNAVQNSMNARRVAHRRADLRADVDRLPRADGAPERASAAAGAADRRPAAGADPGRHAVRRPDARRAPDARRRTRSAALRAAGCLHTHEVERATIETHGRITAVLRNRD